MHSPLKCQPKSIKQIVQELVLKELEKDNKRKLNVVVVPMRLGQQWGSRNLKKLTPSRGSEQALKFSPINCSQISPDNFKEKERQKYQRLLNLVTEKQKSQEKKRPIRMKSYSLNINQPKKTRVRLPELPKVKCQRFSQALSLHNVDTLQGYQIEMITQNQSLYIQSLIDQMNKIKRKLFSMESILDSRIVGDQLYYLIKWAGYPISQATWEKAEKVPIDSDLIEEYKFNVQMVGKCFYFDPLDQPPQIEDFVEVPPPKSELSTFNCKLTSFQKQLSQLRDDVRQILQIQKIVLQDLKEPKTNEIISDDESSLKSSEEHMKQQSEEQYSLQCDQNEEDGSFELGDRVDKIGRAVQIKNKNIIMYYVLWKRRQNGLTPKNSWVASDLLKEHEITLLCRYLWSKL